MRVEQIAKEFYQAYKEKMHVDTLTKRNIEIDETTAYQIQDLITNLKIEDNREKILGYKISMTSEKTQKMGNSTSPTYGTFTSTNLLKGPVILDPDFILLIEPELVFVITDDLSIGANADEIMKKSKIAAGLEIPGSRYPNWFPPQGGLNVADNIVDNACGGMIAIGEAIEIPESINWSKIGVRLYFNEKQIDEGLSEEVLGNPVNAVTWLTSKLAEEEKQLKKGMIVSSGTFTLPKIIERGTYRGVFDIVGELTVDVR